MKHCEKCEQNYPDSMYFCSNCKKILKKGEYEAAYKDGDNVARCKKCGRKYSTDSLPSDGVCIRCLYKNETREYEYKHN